VGFGRAGALQPVTYPCREIHAWACDEDAVDPAGTERLGREILQRLHGLLAASDDHRIRERASEAVGCADLSVAVCQVAHFLFNACQSRECGAVGCHCEPVLERRDLLDRYGEEHRQPARSRHVVACCAAENGPRHLQADLMRPGTALAPRCRSDESPCGGIDNRAPERNLPPRTVHQYHAAGNSVLAEHNIRYVRAENDIHTGRKSRRLQRLLHAHRRGERAVAEHGTRERACRRIPLR
jgi:hypothetical protein